MPVGGDYSLVPFFYLLLLYCLLFVKTDLVGLLRFCVMFCGEREFYGSESKLNPCL